MRFSGLGIEFAASVVGLTLLGYWIDGRFDTKPWGLLVGAGIGLVGGMYNMIRDALKATQSTSKSAASRQASDSQDTEPGTRG